MVKEYAPAQETDTGESPPQYCMLGLFQPRKFTVSVSWASRYSAVTVEEVFDVLTGEMSCTFACPFTSVVADDVDRLPPVVENVTVLPASGEPPDVRAAVIS